MGKITEVQAHDHVKILSILFMVLSVIVAVIFLMDFSTTGLSLYAEEEPPLFKHLSIVENFFVHVDPQSEDVVRERLMKVNKLVYPHENKKKYTFNLFSDVVVKGVVIETLVTNGQTRTHIGNLAEGGVFSISFQRNHLEGIIETADQVYTFRQIENGAVLIQEMAEG